MNCYRGIALSFGYVESNTTSWLVYQPQRNYRSSRKEALLSLVEYLWEKYKFEKDEEVESGIYKKDRCCKDFWWQTQRESWDNEDKWVKPTHCGTCNKEYGFTWQFNESDWQQYLFNIHSSNCDNYGEHDFELSKNPDGWTPWQFEWDVPQHQMVIVNENAEVVLTQMLYTSHPELRGQDSEVLMPEDKDYGFYSSDTKKLLDESCVYYRSGYHTQDELKNYPYKQTTIYDYVAGGSVHVVNGRTTYIKYANGDQIWIDFLNDEYVVTKVVTHDGLEFNYDS